MKEEIKAALEKVRPALQMDGGDVEFVDFTDDKVVKVKLQGHCCGCPMSQMTVKGFIKKALRESFPDIKGVETVN